MVTRIRQRLVRRRVFLKEHRKAHNVTAQQMGDFLGIERESVHRLERENWRVKNETVAAYADRLGIAPEELWRLPRAVSLDRLAESVPEGQRELATDLAADVLKRFAAAKG